MLIPSTITARRTRRYTSTLYIRRTIHGFGYNPMNDGGRYSIQSPFVSNLPPAWSTLPPPITVDTGDDQVGVLDYPLHLAPYRLLQPLRPDVGTLPAAQAETLHPVDM